GLDEAGFRDSDAVLEWPEIPESVVVLGAGATGLEFAHYFAGLGTRVTVLQRGRQVLKEMDSDVANALGSALQQRGMEILYGTNLLCVEKCAAGKRIHFQHEGAEKSVEAGVIIYELGRTPELRGLDLERAALQSQHGRLEVNSFQQTNVKHILAAGDVAGPFEIVHLAIQQAELAARNAAKLVHGKPGELEKINYRLKLFVVFTFPEVAVVGATEAELQREDVPYFVATYRFADHGKPMIRGE